MFSTKIADALSCLICSISLRDVGGGGLGVGRDAFRREEGQPVFVLEIAEGVVRGDDGALVGRDRRDGGLHLGLQRVELAGVGGGIGL